MEGENTENNFDEQYDEVQALESIFMEDFVLCEERPFKFEITIKANSESEERNFLKLKLVIDIPELYP